MSAMSELAVAVSKVDDALKAVEREEGMLAEAQAQVEAATARLGNTRAELERRKAELFEAFPALAPTVAPVTPPPVEWVGDEPVEKLDADGGWHGHPRAPWETSAPDAGPDPTAELPRMEFREMPG